MKYKIRSIVYLKDFKVHGTWGERFSNIPYIITDCSKERETWYRGEGCSYWFKESQILDPKQLKTKV